jgi:hypothetical protein
MKRLTKSQRDKLALLFGYDPKAIDAIIAVETSGGGFTPNGEIIINFEPHIFKKYSKLDIPEVSGTQTSQWIAYQKAAKVYPTYAKLSTSFGLGQIMGFNFKNAGFSSVDEMVLSFRESEENQLKGMLTFIKNNRYLDKALKAKDWRTFAYYYNGPLYHLNQYDKKLANAYEQAA